MEKIYYGLTHPQKRIWYIDKVNSGSVLHNIGGCLKINEKIDIIKLNEILNIIIKSNDGLRLRFIEKDGEPFQYVAKYEYQNFEYQDFSSSSMKEIDYCNWVENIYKRKIELNDNQMFYFAIYKKSDKEYGVLLCIHHIIADGWSISLIQRQLCELYEKMKRNKEIKIDECYSYLDYIKDEKLYLNSERFKRNKNFWLDKFNNKLKDSLYLTTDNLVGQRESFNIENNLTKKIKSFTNKKKYSLNTFFIAILLIYINKLTYKEDLVIGTPVFNRNGKKHKNIIGMFTSTVPCRFKIDTDMQIDELLDYIDKEFKVYLYNQKYPYDLMIKDLNIGKRGYDSLYKMSVNYYNSKIINQMDGIDIQVEEYYSGNQSYSLQIIVKDWDQDHIKLDFDYKVKEYSQTEIHAMYQSMINIIEGLFKNITTKVKAIKHISEEDINYKIHTFNDTVKMYPNKTVYELFQEQVVKHPDRIAVEFKNEKLTYKELEEKSNQLANYLSENDVTKTTLVGLIMNHSIELVLSILAILKTGGAYIPIEPEHPLDRIEYMLDDAECQLVLTDMDHDFCAALKRKIVYLQEIDLSNYNKEGLKMINCQKDLAYIIYTSGSTGKPKGVMVEHGGLTNYIYWANKMYLKEESEAMALYTSIAFDLTVTSIFTPLISGNKIIVYDKDDLEFVLYKLLRENKVTVIKMTPAHLTLLKDMDNRDSNIKRIIVGGEDLKAALAYKIYKSFGDDVEIYNEYGPTETVVGCMIHQYDVKADNDISVPIGHPADNVQIYILDQELKPVPTGVTGEIFISGDGVARGYLKQMELTNNKFLNNPFIYGKRMYRTGDNARFKENGLIEYIGRADNQVKLKGHRIELKEIEMRLMEYEKLKEAVVVIRKVAENAMLNAYVVCKEIVSDLELKNWLLMFLPKYMIPNNFIYLEKIPLTINGKVDVCQLPLPDVKKRKFEGYKTELEKCVVQVIQDLLGVENISMNDNYFQLGGDSIKAIQISSRLKEESILVTVKDILTYDTIEEIAAMAKMDTSLQSWKSIEDKGDIELMPITQWFFRQGFYNENQYMQYLYLEIDDQYERNLILNAANTLTRYHDALRINYNKEKNKLFYNEKHMDTSLQMNLIDLLGYSQEEKTAEIERIIYYKAQKMRLEDGFLFGLTMFQLGMEKAGLLFYAHHLIVDGISWRILISDFITVLKSLKKKDKVKLPTKTNSLKDWSLYLQDLAKLDYINERIYWNKIENMNFNFPIDFNEENEREEYACVASAFLEEDTIDTLIKKANKIYALDLRESFIIALLITINDITNKEDIILELEGHGRENISQSIDISRTVGWFTCIYPAYFKLDKDGLENRIKSVKEQLRNIPYKGFNYGILKFLKNEIKDNRIKYVRFNYLGDFDNILTNDTLNISDIKFGLISDKNNQLTALMDIAVIIVNKRAHINITYSNKRFKNETIKNFIDTYVKTLKRLAEHFENSHHKVLTPADFDAVKIEQADLDLLFE
jgi:amino acid adenylation domain-containing protein/non-ribosomal peptide synthase protein (TIGR01720 family)